MSKVLWHTMTIKVPSEMVEITKTGKVSIKKTLTKMNNISKSQGYPSIKLVKSSDNKPHIITDGKEWNIEQLKTTLNKSNELAKKNKGRVLTKKLIQPLKDNKFIENIKNKVASKVNNGIELSEEEVILMLYDIYRRKLHIPFDYIPKLLIDGKQWLETIPDGIHYMRDEYNNAIKNGQKYADGIFELYTYDKYHLYSSSFKNPKFKLLVYNIKPELFPKGKPVLPGGRKHLH